MLCNRDVTFLGARGTFPSALSLNLEIAGLNTSLESLWSSSTKGWIKIDADVVNKNGRTEVLVEDVISSVW